MYLTGLGTAVPPRRFTQAECWVAVQLAPQYPDLEQDHAFLYSGGSVADLGALLPVPFDDSIASSINNLGQIVGRSAFPAPSHTHAFLYDAGSMHDLGTLGAGGESAAYGINNGGKIVGTSTILPGKGHPPFCFVWVNGVMSKLPLPSSCFVTAINDQDLRRGPADGESVRQRACAEQGIHATVDELHAELRERVEVERGTFRRPGELHRRHATGAHDVVDLVVALVEHTGSIHPPLQVLAPINTRRPNVLTYR